ncbi:MAG: VWA domain-containing protein [Bacteroidales bacterium]|nr:VWA domain-containing protein [Bacteroidales bacterium]MBN2819595.1 VWA domain-containing protein [Bacteroidales bacterium]
MKNLKSKFCFLIVIGIVISCSDDKYNGPETDSWTQIFGEAPPPDTNNYSSGSIKIGFSGVLTDGYSEAASGGSASSTGSWGNGASTNQGIEPEAGLITAAEWCDLENWTFWEAMLENEEYLEDVNIWDVHILSRYSFEVKDVNGNPLPNALVSLKSGSTVIWKASTDSKGKAELWSQKSAKYLSAEIEYLNESQRIPSAKEYNEGINKSILGSVSQNENLADIMFVVDATGSMSDEINYLKAELNHVIAQINNTNENLIMNMGSVFYRDEGDEYVTNPFNFTTNKDELISFIDNQEANGGGDFPEAVHTALEVAIQQMAWNSKSKNKLLFLLLDAPPHYNQEVVSSLQEQITSACEKGIKIIPITASGIDKATEFLMRSIANLTNSTYVFITDDSGIGNDHLEPTIGQYEIEKLNKLLIRLISEYTEN